MLFFLHQKLNPSIAFNLSEESTFEELIYISGQVKTTLGITLDHAFFALYKYCLKKPSCPILKGHMRRMIWASIEQRHYNDVAK